MQNLTLNETPIRTSKSYKINNIKLNNIVLPNAKTSFDTFSIQCEGAVVQNNCDFPLLKYGNGQELFLNLKEYINSEISIKTIQEKAKATIVFNFDDDNTELSSVIDIEIKNDIDITIIYKSKTQKPCYHNGAINLNVQNNACAHVEIINLTNEQTNNFSAIQCDLQEGAKTDIVIADMGAKNSVFNVFSDIIGKKAQCDINTVYIAQGEQLKDINYISHLKGKKSVANINVQGALLGSAKKNFKGTIDFKKGAKKAKGNEQEYCMLLSDDASSTALPMLLCTEDDVEGTHSAASGQADKGQVFYLMSRGLSRQEAIKLLIKAKYYEILQKITNEELRREILEEIDRRLS